MEYEAATPPRLVGDERSAPAGSRLFFASRDYGGQDLGSPSPIAEQLDHDRLKPARHRQRLVILACAASCAALLAYGVSSRIGGHRTSASRFTFHLPPAESAAAVKALPPPNLLKPLSPGEASKENAERPFVSRPDSPARPFFLKTDTQDRERALTCLAQASYYEAAGEGVDGERAVAQVILNRMRHPGFPSTICGVVYEGSDHPTGCQFSFTCDGSMQHIPIPWLWARSKQIAEAALKGRVFAPVGHATHYHADYVLPYWADSLDKSVQIGRHIFYRLRSSLGDARAFSQRYGGSEPPFREPGTILSVPQTAETQELTNALIGGGSGATAVSAEKASPPPTSPLLVDLQQGVLLADRGHKSEQASASPKSQSRCAGSDYKPLSALKADDMRASLGPTNC